MAEFSAQVSRTTSAISCDGHETSIAYLDNVVDASGARVAGVLCIDDEHGELMEGDDVAFEATSTRYTVSSYGCGKRLDEIVERLCEIRLRKGKDMSNPKQERYDHLRSINDAEEAPYNDELYTEQVQLYYELDPNRQYWRDTSPDLTPRDAWGVDTSCYDK